MTENVHRRTKEILRDGMNDCVSFSAFNGAKGDGKAPFVPDFL